MKRHSNHHVQTHEEAGHLMEDAQALLTATAHVAEEKVVEARKRLAAAIEKHDPDYLRDNKQFRGFLAHELRRSIGIYRRGMKLDHFRWERRLERNLMKQDDSQEIRQVVQRLYGDDLTLEDLLED